MPIGYLLPLNVIKEEWVKREAYSERNDVKIKIRENVARQLR